MPQVQVAAVERECDTTGSHFGVTLRTREQVNAQLRRRAERRREAAEELVLARLVH